MSMWSVLQLLGEDRSQERLGCGCSPSVPKYFDRLFLDLVKWRSKHVHKTQCLCSPGCSAGGSFYNKRSLPIFNVPHYSCFCCKRQPAFPLERKVFSFVRNSCSAKSASIQCGSVTRSWKYPPVFCFQFSLVCVLSAPYTQQQLFPFTAVSPIHGTIKWDAQEHLKRLLSQSVGKVTF